MNPRIVIALLVPLACGAVRVESPKGREQRLSTQKVSSVTARIMPSIVTTSVWHTFYYAVTATDTNGMESAFSNEVSTNRSPVTVAWDPSVSTGITNYTVYRGTNSGSYQWTYSVGTKLSSLIPPAKTLVITVTGSNLYSRSGLTGVWIPVPTNTVTLTNPAGTLYWRGKGAKIVPSWL